MKNMLLIKDLRNWLWATCTGGDTYISLNVEYVVNYFTGIGYNVEVTSYSEFDFSKNYADYVVIYSSSEDYCGGSKAFFEDILVHLCNQGAMLLPEFKYFRAHDNKVMMEILRNEFNDNRLKTIHSDVWSSYEELKAAEITEYPIIVKRAGGAGGEGVFLAHNRTELYKYAEKVSRMTNLLHFYYMTCVNVKQRLIGKEPVPIHNSKFITQNYIAGLTGDYKVLVFGSRYFVLHRLNRNNDFRASGSGKFTEDNVDEIEDVLDFAAICTKEINTPWLSIDICHDGSACHLIEFQGLTFGFKAMSMSKQHYVREMGQWKVIKGKVVPEELFCDSIECYLKNKGGSTWESSH